MFHHRTKELKRDAFRLVPGGLTLARIGITWVAAQALFGTFPWLRGGLMRTKLTGAFDPSTVVTNVHVLERGGWTR